MDHRKLKKGISILIFARSNSNKVIPMSFFKNKASKYIQVDEVLQKQLEEKAKFWIKKYEDLSGYTKVSEMQEKVLEVQKDVQLAQEQRRKVQEELISIQKKLQETQELLYKTSISDKMHISYVTQVRDLLMEQKRIQDLLSLYDLTEKEQQTNFALAIKHSHDNENNHREKNKFLSVISGVVCGVVGILFTSIYNWRQRKNMRTLSSQISDLQNTVSNLPLIEASKEEIQTNKKTEMELEKLLSLMNNCQETLHKVQSSLDSPKMDKVNFNYLENSIDNKLKTHALVNLSMTSLLLIGSYILYISSR